MLSRWHRGFWVRHLLSGYFVGALLIIFAVLNLYSAEIVSRFSGLIVHVSRSEIGSVLARKVGLSSGVSELQPLITTHFETLKSPEEAPIIVGAINRPFGAYVHIQLRFRADSLDGHPNLFQTAGSNRGIRVEIAGAVAAIILPDTSQPNGVRWMWRPKMVFRFVVP
jgi:hypothetical protein